MVYLKWVIASGDCYTKFCSVNHLDTSFSFFSNHLILFSTFSMACFLALAPAPASGYFAKNALSSSSSNFVLNPEEIVLGIRPRYLSFKLNLSTMYGHSSLTNFHTMGFPMGFLDM